MGLFSLVAGAYNQRYLRLVERQIPKLAEQCNSLSSFGKPDFRTTHTSHLTPEVGQPPKGTRFVPTVDGGLHSLEWNEAFIMGQVRHGCATTTHSIRAIIMWDSPPLMVWMARPTASHCARMGLDTAPRKEPSIEQRSSTSSACLLLLKTCQTPRDQCCGQAGGTVPGHAGLDRGPGPTDRRGARR